MDFDFSQEQYFFQDTVRNLLADLRSMEALRAGPDDARLWQALAENGVFALALPEEDGGMGLGFVDLALIFEEFGRALVPAHVAASITCGALLGRHGTAAQRRSLAPGLADGSLRLTHGFAEVTGAVPGAVQLSAVRDGDGWVAQGEKILVPEAEGAEAILVVLRFGGGALGLALVRPDQEGVTLRAEQTLDLTGRWHSVRMDGVRLDPEAVLGGHPDAGAAMVLFDMAAGVSALQMTGIAAKALDEAVAYVQQRQQFGKVIGSFQAIKHRCADMAVGVEASRSAAYYAAWALDEAAPGERAQAVSMAKAWCGDQGRFVCNQAIQLHGGTGFTWELGLHLFLRRQKVEEVLWGDADWHRERVIAEGLRMLVPALAAAE